MKGNKRKGGDTGTFHIRLGANIEKIDLKDPVFLKILQQEYATKYLQSMGVEASSKNIAKILKQRPLDSCQIVESRLTGGLHTDTITVITRTQSSSSTKTGESQTVSSQMLKILDLRKMAEKKENNVTEKKIQTVNTQKVKQEQEKKGLDYLDFSIKSIKLRYIFPFNENFVRKNNYKMRDLSNIIEKDKQQSKLIFESSIFKFPFTQIKLTLNTLKQLQTPITTKLVDVTNFLEKFYLYFPKEVFPVINNTPNKANYGLSALDSFVDMKNSQDFKAITVSKQSQKNINLMQMSKNTTLSKRTQKKTLHNISDLRTQQDQQKFNLHESFNPAPNPNASNSKQGLYKEIHITFEKKVIDKMFEIIRSEENAKLIGIFLHLSYWAVFGGVNPLQIDSGMKKKMFLIITETMKYFQLKTQVKKNWITLVQPMILLTLKMALDYFFHLEYSKLFFSEQSVKIGANQLAFDKILLFVDKILDQSSINGRFIFLESDIDGPKGNFMKDKKFIRKRIFGTSPGLQLILPEPKDGKARSIIAKNIQIDQKDGTLQENAQYHHQQQDKECRQKLLNLTLLKIRSRIEQMTGPNSTNPIIRLQDKE